jgi:hypothetical protein
MTDLKIFSDFSKNRLAEVENKAIFQIKIALDGRYLWVIDIKGNFVV